MSTQLACPQGHRWPIEGGSACPVCGESAQTLPATPTEAFAAETRTTPPGGPPLATPVAAEVPAFLVNHSRYRVLELLGQGGMGAVYKAEHLLMQRAVALKVIGANLTGNPAAVQRFQREVRAVARLNHPSIVTAHDAEHVGDAHFLVMEYVPGQSLARLIAECGPLPIDRACDFVRQAAEGLEHAHKHGHVHRDIKPQNLMVTPEGQVKILDFGLARLATERRAAEPPLDASLPPKLQSGHSLVGFLTQAGSVMGTPDYIAPEQASDPRSADIRADIYSLGCTFYHLLTGRTPFTGNNLYDKLLAHQEQTPTPVQALRPDVPEGVARIVNQMMAKRPAERFQTPGDVARALQPYRLPVVTKVTDKLVPGIPVVLAAEVAAPTQTYFETPRPTTPTPQPAPKKRSRVFLGCLVLLLVFFLGLAAILFWMVDLIGGKVKEVAGLFQDHSTQEQLWTVVEDIWRAPPESIASEDLFPRSLDGYLRVGSGDFADVELLRLKLPGRHAVYGSDNGQMQIYAYRVSAELRDEVFKQAQEAINAGDQFRVSRSSSTATSKRLNFAAGMPPVRGVMWWREGWLFVALSPNDDDAERMLVSYLRAISVKSESTSKTSTPAKTVTRKDNTPNKKDGDGKNRKK